MEYKKYFPTQELQKDFEIYKSLKTKEEKAEFQKNREKRYELKTDKQKVEYQNDLKRSMQVAEKRIEELSYFLMKEKSSRILSFA